MADINYPINPERRDPFYSKSKGDIGLSKVPNMSFSELNNAILANVNNQVNEGTIYHLDKKIGDTGGVREFPLFKMKSESAYTNVIFGLGEWTGNKEYIGKDCARVELILSGEVINYNLSVSNSNSENIGEDTDIKWNVNGLPDGKENNYPEPGFTDMIGRGEYPDQSDGEESSGPVIDKNKYLAKTKLRLRKFKSKEGYLVSLVCEEPKVDAIWVNLTWCRNIDPVNVVDPDASSTWPDSMFEKEISFYCEKSRISGNLCIEGGIDGISAYSRSLNHDIPIKTVSNDPSDNYNNNANSHSISNLVPGEILVENSNKWTKENSIREVELKSNEIECKNPQNIPLSINRLNHQIKFGLEGISVHPKQVESWTNAQNSQSNKRSFIDTDIDPNSKPLSGVNNWFPLGISRLTHDINVSAGRGKYEGSKPEEITNDKDTTKGEGYNQYTYNSSDKTMNYVTFSSTATGKGSHYEYDESNESKWIPVEDTLSTPDKTKSLDTDTDKTNDLNMIVHGLDHDILIEIVDSKYRNDRGGACTKDDTSLKDAVSNTAAIHNLTLEESTSEPRTETRRNSCATGLFSLNTFDKSIYQCLDIKVHGLDHIIKVRGYRVNVPNPLNDPTEAGDTGGTNQFRRGSNAQDILGDIEIDTYTTRVQKRKLEVIDSRYTDCARGLALTEGTGNNTNFIPYSKVEDSGKHEGSNSKASYSNAPTINGVPFTGDFRLGVDINSNYTFDSTMHDDKGSPIRVDSQANSNARHIEIAAYHRGSGKETAGPHKWEVLSKVRNCRYDINSRVYSHETYLADNVSDSPAVNSTSYGLCRLAGFTNSIIEGASSSLIIKSFRDYIKSINGSDDSVITIPILKSLLTALVGSDDNYGIIGSVSKDKATKAGCPVGTIVMWSGGTSEIGTGSLSGWKLCDGTGSYEVNGRRYNVPKLTDKFIKGIGTEDIGATGGNSNQSITLTQNNLPNHTHTGTVGSHTHGMKHTHDIIMVGSGKDQAKKETGSNSGKYIPYLFGPHSLEGHDTTNAGVVTNVASGDKSMKNGKTETDSATPSLTINKGGGKDNPSPIVISEPSYYVLAYIIKIS